MKYIKEIDGLRALAIISIIIFHFGKFFPSYEILKGGFLGVDIFFVISGYLITRILLKELLLNNKIIFKNFYLRRIKRIFPAIFFLLSFVMFFGYFFLPEKHFFSILNQIFFTLIISSNVYFWKTGNSYWSDDNLTTPLLHTWSLSIEEQFYILFPIFLTFIYKFFSKKTCFIFLFIITINLIITHYISIKHPHFNFYFITSRVWEILIGSSIAVFHQNYKGVANVKFINSIDLLSLILVFFPLFFFNEEMLHPSFFTILPIIGISAIILFINQKSFLKTILANDVLRYVGLLSYSLYLWHYPILSFYKILNIGNNDFLDIIILLNLIIFISFISYRYIEKPFRLINNYKNISKNYFFYFLFLLLITILFYFNKTSLDKISKERKLRSECSFRICSNNTVNNNGKIKVYLLGDSHAETLYQDLKKKFSKKYNFYSLTSHCFLVPDIKIEISRNINFQNKCNKFNNKVSKFLSNKSGGIIIVFSKWTAMIDNGLQPFNNGEGGIAPKKNYKILRKNQNDSKTVEEGYKNYFNFLLKKNHKMIIVYPYPEQGWNVPLKAYNYKKNISINFELFTSRTKKAFKFLDSIKSKNIERVYPHELTCNTMIKNRCVGYYKNKLYYEDDNHPSYYASILINNLIINKIEKKIKN